jgi:hypothetical protein
VIDDVVGFWWWDKAADGNNVFPYPSRALGHDVRSGARHGTHMRAPPPSPYLLHDDEEDVGDDVDEDEDEDHEVSHGQGTRVAGGAQLVRRLHDGVAVPEAEERGEGPGGVGVGGWGRKECKCGGGGREGHVMRDV